MCVGRTSSSYVVQFKSGDNHMAKKRGDGMSKAEAVRQAIAAGVDQPQEASAYIKEKFGLEVSPPMFSSYKSQMKKRQGGRGRRKARGNGPAGGVDLARKVKALVDEYGADAVKEMAEVFGE
jgi:hypothetical protein